MKRVIALLTLLMSSSTAAYAQTSTPTPPPAPALDPGFHVATDPLLQAAYSGSGWAILQDGDYSVMESSVAGDSISFDVLGSQIVVYRDLLTDGGGTAQICIDAACASFSSDASIDQRSVPVAYLIPAGGGAVTIEVLTGTLRIHSYLVIGAAHLVEVAAPDPSRHYVVLEDGSVAAIDRSIDLGDLVTIGMIAALIAAVAIGVITAAWKR